MKQFIDKLISRLEEKARWVAYGAWDRDIGMTHKVVPFSDIREIGNQLAEEYKGGWIPCSERLPEKNDSVLCWAKSTARGGDVCFVGSCHNGFWFLQSSADTHTFPGQYVVVAWKPIEPYQKEGE